MQTNPQDVLHRQGHLQCRPPRLAMKAVMFTPRLDRMASSTTLHSKVRSPHDMSVAEALTCVMPEDACCAR